MSILDRFTKEAAALERAKAAFHDADDLYARAGQAIADFVGRRRNPFSTHVAVARIEHATGVGSQVARAWAYDWLAGIAEPNVSGHARGPVEMGRARPMLSAKIRELWTGYQP